MKPVDFYLVRGLAREEAHWGEFGDLLKKQEFTRNVYFLETPGTGRFHKLTSPLSISQNAEFILTQINQSEGASRVLISISMGGMVAVELARKNPDLFDKIYIMNSSFSGVSPLLKRLQPKAMKQLVKIVSTKDPVVREKEALKMVSENTFLHNELSRDYARIAQERPTKLSNVILQLVAAGTYRLPKKKPKTPIVVLRSLADAMVHPDCSKKFAERWGLPLYSVEGAGHDLPTDAPEWLIDTIKETL